MFALGRQGHSGTPGWDGKPDPLYVPRAGIPFKPPRAFWTSSLLDDGTTDWTRFDAGGEAPDYLYDPRPGVNLLVLRSDGDILDAMRRAGLHDAPPARTPLEAARTVASLADPTRLEALWRWAEHFHDGVHLPADRCRRSMLLRLWDCESTAWFRPWDSRDLVLPAPHP